ncbi:MAG TPA: carboxyl-terminal protease [Solibacterales bacterium]|nr:carboxyl-terminal protease [Bryobacterales bacterium]
MNSRLKLFVVTLSTCLVVLLLLGAMLGAGTPAGEPYKHLSVFSEVISRIKSDYVEEPDMKNVTLGAVAGLLESLDPYASYLNPEQYKQFQKKDAMKGSVGLLLSRRFGYVGVVDAIPGSPADKAGLGTGDMLESIGGISTKDMPLAYADLLLHGEPGTNVELSVLRVRRPEPQKITLSRAAVKYPAVSAKMLDGGVGHIRAASLESGKTKEIAAAIATLQKQGMKKLVLDLRHAAAGDNEEGPALANLFVEKGVLTYLQGQKVARQDFAAVPQNVVFKDQLVVITNRGTARGAEIAAAALLDAQRAAVVGERTYGDAALRKPVLTDEGGAVILSVAKYYSPSGKAIQDVAVTPNHQVAEVQDAPDADDDTDGAAPAPAEEPKKPTEDLLLKRALEVLGGGTVQAGNPTAAKPEPVGGDKKAPSDLLTPLNVPKKNQ